MHTVKLSEAKLRLSELIDLAEAGEDVLITRRGLVVARLTANRQQQLPDLSDFRAKLPFQEQSAGEFVRELRDTDRY